MADSLDPAVPDRPGIERRRSRNPIKNMMQHLTVDAAEDRDESGIPRRQSLIRRLSRRSSRSVSVHSDAGSVSVSGPIVGYDPALCDMCASIAADIELTVDEMDFAFATAVNPGSDDAYEKKEYFVARLRGLEDNRWAATCPLCKLWWEMRVPGDGDGDYSLSAFSTRNTNYFVDSIKMYDMNHPAMNKSKGLCPGFLAVVPKKKGPGARPWEVSPDWFRESGMLLRTQPEAISGAIDSRGRPAGNGSLTPEPPRTEDETWLRKGIWGREIGRQADLAIAGEWLHYCETHHRDRCGRRNVAAELEGFRLIDCGKNPPEVVERSLADNYVALSYVWGKNTTEKWPRVVRDAAAVTRDLGVRYLWVDRLCLDDSRLKEKRQHIARMNEIFEGAVVTIIAACGEDAMHGLPGVGSTTRTEQPSYKFGNSSVTIVSSMQDPRVSVQASTWYTRGWTYQEGLLARRRLIFTDQQMYWECDGMACPEALVLPLDLYHDTEEQRMCDFMRPGLFNGVSYVDGSWEVWKKLPRRVEQPSTLSIFRESDRHIVNYSKRQLTVDEDSLSAFLGITRRLEGTLGKGKLANIVGIPIWVPSDDAGGGRLGRPRTRDLFALSTAFWHHKPGSELPRRRRHLPSWTWAGWNSPVDLFSSIVISDPEGQVKDRKTLNHHYVSITQLTRNEQSSLQWTYSPEMVLVRSDGGVAYDFGPVGSRSDGSPLGPPRLPPAQYALRVSNPLVLDRVKARTHAGGWMFNELSVDVRLSRGRGTDAATVPGTPSAIREYLERHARGEQMTVLWFIEEAMILLLVVEKTERGAWERVGRVRMAFVDDVKTVLKKYRRIEAMLEVLPLRPLGRDIVIE